MPNEINPQQIARQLRQDLLIPNLSNQQITQILNTAIHNAGGADRFVAHNILNQAMQNLDHVLRHSVRQIARTIIPPPRLPAGVEPRDVRAARILHGGTRQDQVDRNWAAQMVALAGAEFDVDAYNPQRLVGDALRSSGFTERPGNIEAAQSQGAALARNFWSDGFASSIELASAFMYAQNLPNDQKAEFQNNFAREFANQVQTRYQDPQRQRYIMMQMTRFLANTNWAGNEGFRDFISSITNEMANSLPAYQGLRNQLDGVPRNQRAVVQTYDLPGENNTYGAAVMLAYRDNNGNIQTEVVRHRPGPNENLWRFNFPPMPATAPQAVPGAGGGPGVPAVVNPGAGNMPANWPAAPAAPAAAPGAPAPATPVTPTPALVFQRRDRDTVGGYVQTTDGTRIYTTGTDENGRHVNGFEIAPDGTRTETRLLPANRAPQQSLLRPEEAIQHLQLQGTGRRDSAGERIYERAGFVGDYMVRDNGTVYFAGGFHRNGVGDDIPLPPQTYINGRWYQGNVRPQAAPVAPPGAAPGIGEAQQQPGVQPPPRPPQPAQPPGVGGAPPLPPSGIPTQQHFQANGGVQNPLTFINMLGQYPNLIPPVVTHDNFQRVENDIGILTGRYPPTGTNDPGLSASERSQIYSFIGQYLNNKADYILTSDPAEHAELQTRAQVYSQLAERYRREA